MKKKLLNYDSTFVWQDQPIRAAKNGLDLLEYVSGLLCCCREIKFSHAILVDFEYNNFSAFGR